MFADGQVRSGNRNVTLVEAACGWARCNASLVAISMTRNGIPSEVTTGLCGAVTIFSALRGNRDAAVCRETVFLRDSASGAVSSAPTTVPASRVNPD